MSGFEGQGLTSLDGLPAWYTGKSLMDTLWDLGESSEPIVETVQLLPIPATVSQTLIQKNYIVLMKVLICPSIICGGYQGICHLDGREYEFELLKIKGARFLKAGDLKLVKIRIYPPALIHSGSRLIFRKDQNTIGFGKPHHPSV